MSHLEAMALFDFEAQRSAELSLNEGDRLVVIEADPTKKWWLVRTADGTRRGFVPHNFVAFPEEILADEELEAADGATARGGGAAAAAVAPAATTMFAPIAPSGTNESAEGCAVATHINTTAPGAGASCDGLSAAAAAARTSAGAASLRTDSRCSSASITSAQFIESLLDHKRRSGVITQNEYDLIMETRKTARELMEADGVDEFDPAPVKAMDSPPSPPPHGADDRSPSSEPRPAALSGKGKQAASASPRPTLFKKLLGTGQSGSRPSIEVLHPWTGDGASASSASLAPVPGSPKLVPLASARNSFRNSTASAGGGGGGADAAADGTADGAAAAEGPAAGAAEAASPSRLSLMASELAVDKKQLEEWNASAEKRELIVTEILETERSYVSVLRMLLDVFADPLRRAADLPPEHLRPSLLGSRGFEFTKKGVPKVQISRAQAKVIFHELDSLAAINQLLLEQLEERYAAWSSAATVGDVFLSIMSFLKGYTAFANNFNNALATITECKRQQGFTAYLEHCIENKEECCNLWLEDHLIAPIQRIPRYILLLNSLLGKTPSSHPDFELLSQCVISMKAIARHINENKKRSEGALKIIEVQRTVKRCPMIVSPSRCFIFDMMGCTEMKVLDQARAKAIVDGDDGDDVDRRRVLAIGDGEAAPAASRRRSYIGSPADTISPTKSLGVTSPLKPVDCDEDVEATAGTVDLSAGLPAESAAAEGVDAANSDAAAPAAEPSGIAAVATWAAEVAASTVGTEEALRAALEDPPPEPGPAATAPDAVRMRAKSADPRLSGGTQPRGLHARQSGSDDGSEGTLRDASPVRSYESKLPLFASNVDVSLYLFNDALLIASHVMIQDMIGKAYESIKILNRGLLGTKDAPVRQFDTDEDGEVVAIHKFKFQRMDSLDVISISDFPNDDLLKHGFVIHFPQGPVYYSAATAKMKADFFTAFQLACEAHGKLVEAQIEALQRAYIDPQ
mmetsp:Transcript_16777/g.49347  ORF Transcript_16777/g.49347 Transcript_16777/m.49347 type:complete len:973 (+) Transcript_16777:151-3069(+)